MKFYEWAQEKSTEEPVRILRNSNIIVLSDYVVGVDWAQHQIIKTIFMKVLN